MGIKGLWKEVQPACRAAHVSQFRGQRVGVDTYCWLHRAIISCTLELATEKPCDQYLGFVMGRVEMLLRFGVTPVLVFDGDSMPMKRVTDVDRKSRRAQALQDARQLLAQGSVEDAVRMFEKSLEVSKELAYSAMVVAQDRGIECIVAPYEADAQLAFLAREGHVQAVISEDSDLLVYNCPVLLAKLDHNGNCDAVKSRDVHHVLGQGGTRSLPYESFVMSCIVSGCDYLPSLPGIGVKTAFRLIAAAKSVPDLMNTLATQHGFTSRELGPYEETLHQAFYCFAHHLVYDPQSKKVVCFTPLPDKEPHRAELIGALWDDHTAERVCKACAWDPILHAPYTLKHQPCIDLYFAKTKKGQQSLTAFSGFERMKAARVVLAANVTKTSAEEAMALFGAPLAKMVQTSGFLGPGPSLKSDVVLLRSRFFATRGPAAALAELEAAIADDALRVDADDDGAVVASLATNGASPSPMAQPAASSDSADDDEQPLLAEDASPAAGHQSPPVAPSPPSESQQMERSVPCPHGYAECGTVHTVFLRCSDGKGWAPPNAAAGARGAPLSAASPPMASAERFLVEQAKERPTTSHRLDTPAAGLPAALHLSLPMKRPHASIATAEFPEAPRPAPAIRRRTISNDDDDDGSQAVVAASSPPMPSVLQGIDGAASLLGVGRPIGVPAAPLAGGGFGSGATDTASFGRDVTYAAHGAKSAGPALVLPITATSDSTKRAMDLMSSLRLPTAAPHRPVLVGMSRRGPLASSMSAAAAAAGGGIAAVVAPTVPPAASAGAPTGAQAANDLFAKLAWAQRR